MEHIDDTEIDPVDYNRYKWTVMPIEDNEDHPDFEEFDEDYLMSEPWEDFDLEDSDEEYLKDTTSDEYSEDS